mgnify:CR=1 FL=1
MEKDQVETFLHEFGHSFAGLADEYYTSNVAYDGFYPEGYEPVERNITALDDPANVKWADLVTAGVGIPTEWNKAAYDAMDQAYQAERGMINEQIGAMMRSGADEAAISALKVRYASLNRPASSRSRNA